MEIKLIREIGKITREEGIKTLGEKAHRRGVKEIFSLPLIKHLAYKLSVKELNNRTKQEKNLSDIVETAFSFEGYGPHKSIKPIQIREELTKLGEVIKDRDPSTVMEIGTARGGRSMYGQDI